MISNTITENIDFLTCNCVEKSVEYKRERAVAELRFGSDLRSFPPTCVKTYDLTSDFYRRRNTSHLCTALHTHTRNHVISASNQRRCCLPSALSGTYSRHCNSSKHPRVTGATVWYCCLASVPLTVILGTSIRFIARVRQMAALRHEDYLLTCYVNSIGRCYARATNSLPITSANTPNGEHAMPFGITKM